MIFTTEELDFESLTTEQVHQLAPRRPLGEFSWDTPVRPLPFMDYDLNGYQEAVKAFYQRITLLRCAKDSRHSPTDAQIESFTHYLVENQRDNPKLHFGHGSWAIPEDTAMPGDAAVDFAFVPSYLAVAWLILVSERYPHVAKKVAGLDKSIRRGLRFIFIKDLRGAGFEANRELLKAVEYLSLGMVFSFIERHHMRHPRLVEKVRAIESSIMGTLAQAQGWGSTDVYSRQKALQLIRGGDRDDSIVCPTVWYQWQLSQSAWAYNRVLEIAPSIAARSVFPIVKEKVIEKIQQLREAFIKDKPKHAVFGQPRRVTSEPIKLDLNVMFDTSIEFAIGEVGVVPWANNLSYEGFMKTLKQSFLGRLAYELNVYFESAQQFKDEGFVIYVSKIQVNDSECRMLICAKG